MKSEKQYLKQITVENTMEYKEFCEGIGEEISPVSYNEVETAYMNFDRFQTEEDVFAFYKQHGIKAFEILYEKLQAHYVQRMKIEELNKELIIEKNKLFKMEIVSGINIK